MLGVYCNMRALAHSNVETVIIFRSCTPLAVSLCDWLFLGRELPAPRSLAALLTIAAGKARQPLDLLVGWVEVDPPFTGWAGWLDRRSAPTRLR